MLQALLGPDLAKAEPFVKFMFGKWNRNIIAERARLIARERERENDDFVIVLFICVF